MKAILATVLALLTLACSSDSDPINYMQMEIEDLIPIAESGDSFAQFVLGYDLQMVLVWPKTILKL